MKVFNSQYLAVILLLFVSRASSVSQQKVTCKNKGGPCYLKFITCPVECPRIQPTDQNVKGCFFDCYSPKCEAICRRGKGTDNYCLENNTDKFKYVILTERKPNCNGPGAACFDPRFIGGDGIVFYFHGRSNEHFSLISDPNIQINARFIGHRPEGRTRDYTWIQALGVMLNSHNFSVEAKTVGKWDDEVDQLQFSYDGKALILPEGHLSEWKSTEEDIRIERTSSKNSVRVTITEFAEISINVVPVTEQDSKIHNYQIPPNDCFAHLEVQFRFFALSPNVEGVLGRTYRPDFQNPAKPGVAMPVVGGENKYRTKSLLSSDCSSCMFSPAGFVAKENTLVMEYGTLDCSHGVSGGNGIVCKK